MVAPLTPEQALKVEENKALVYYALKHYRHITWLERTDLYQAGYFGLIRAVRSYDPSRGASFATYATRAIRRFAVREILENANIIRWPVYVAPLLIEANRKQRRALSPGERYVTMVPDFDDVDERAYRFYRFLQGRQRGLIDEVIALIPQIPNERARLALQRRFGLGVPRMGSSKIAKEWRLTHQRVHQLQVWAMKWIRQRLRQQKATEGLILPRLQFESPRKKSRLPKWKQYLRSRSVRPPLSAEQRAEIQKFNEREPRGLKVRNYKLYKLVERIEEFLATVDPKRAMTLNRWGLEIVRALELNIAEENVAALLGRGRKIYLHRMRKKFGPRGCPAYRVKDSWRESYATTHPSAPQSAATET